MTASGRGAGTKHNADTHRPDATVSVDASTRAERRTHQRTPRGTPFPS